MGHRSDVFGIEGMSRTPSLVSGRIVTMDPPHADVRSVLLPSTIVLPVLVISDAGLGMGLRTSWDWFSGRRRVC